MCTLINETATLAAKQLQSNRGKRPTKARVFNRLCELVELGTLSPDDAAYLYAHFMPAAPKTPKSSFSWVQSAAGVKDLRAYINNVYSNGSTLYGTDGHRVHAAPTKLATGFYDTNCAALDLGDLVFPDMSRIFIPKNPTGYVDTGAYPVVQILGDLYAYRLPSGLHVNKAYLDGAMALGGIASLSEDKDALKCRIDFEDSRSVIIMGIRV